MNVRACLLSCSVFAACAAAPTVGRAPQVPPLAIEVPQADLSRDEGLRAAADRRPAMHFDEQALPSGTVTYRTFTHTVEVPVEVVREVPVAGEPVYVGTRGYRDWYDYDRARRRGPWFPVHTVVGAGVGAIIGHQHGHRGRGAWIGAHTGLLLDLARWW